MTQHPSTPATVITIDGPAGAGKSTISKQLAKRLNFTYLDTGAMYRALTLKALNKGLNLEDEQVLITLAQNTDIDITTDGRQNLKVLLDKADVTEDIRTVEVTNNTFYIARVPGVRAVLVDKQRAIGTKTNVVVEGRDVGTVVFPDAQKKFYLDADFGERAKRRIKELREKGKNVDDQNVSDDLKSRDHKDITRKVGPLKKAEDAILIDSTHLTIDEVVEKILSYIE